MCGFDKSAPVVVPRQTILLSGFWSQSKSGPTGESYCSSGGTSRSECRDEVVKVKMGYSKPGRGPSL